MTRAAARKDVYPIGKKNPNLPFHPAVRAGDFIFVSGQVAKDADGNMISGTIEEETRGTIEAIRRILAEEGATLADVVRVTTYLEDARDFGRYNRVFARALQGCRAGAHHRRGAGGDQHQDRDGRDRLQAARPMTSAAICIASHWRRSEIVPPAEWRTRHDQIARPPDIGKRAEGDLLPGGARRSLRARGLRPPVRQHAD